MTTPEGTGTPAERPEDRPAWGTPPAGGWGGDSAQRGWDQGRPDQREPDQRSPDQGGWDQGGRDQGGRDQGGRDQGGRDRGGGWGDPGAETRAWGGSPTADDGPTRVDHPRATPSWAQQPPPGGGWNPGGAPAQPGTWGPPQPGGPAPSGGWGGPPQQGGPDPYGRPPYPAGTGQPGPAWGPPGPGGPGSAPPPGYPPLPRPGDRPARRSRLPFVVAGIVVLLLAVGAVLAFVTPGFLRSTVFDQTALQDGVQRVLLEDYRYGEVTGVACGPPGQQIPVRADDMFTCTATVDGELATVPVRIVSADGTYEVGRPAE